MDIELNVINDTSMELATESRLKKLEEIVMRTREEKEVQVA